MTLARLHATWVVFWLRYLTPLRHYALSGLTAGLLMAAFLSLVGIPQLSPIKVAEAKAALTGQPPALPSKEEEAAVQEAYEGLQLLIRKVCPKDCVDANDLMAIVKKYANLEKIPIYDVLLIIFHESLFDMHAKNGSSNGLMQVHLKYHLPKFLGESPTAVDANVRVGTSIYKACLKRHHNRDAAFRCYNGGGDPQYLAKIRKKEPVLTQALQHAVHHSSTFTTTHA